MTSTLIPELIKKKRDGGELSEEELNELVHEYVTGRVPDYQMSAFLMAVYFQGMSLNETAELVRIMRDSGVSLDLSSLPGKKIDKHSTGGVGDKVSLVLAPLLASMGVVVPMISGRSLGHSGGTLDKLESIPDLNTNLTRAEFYRVLKDVGFVIAGQSQELVPADRKIYALRDATATVESKPLVVASILSKKLVENLDGLVLDVKTGRGAFFSSPKAAVELGKLMIRVGERFNTPIRALLTNMDQPLGRTAGNWVEVQEALACLSGDGPADTMAVVFKLAVMALQLAGYKQQESALIRQLKEKIENGEALLRFEEYVARLGGNVRVLRTPNEYPLPKPIVIRAERSGFVQKLDAYLIGRAAMLAGAGRQNKDEQVDPCAGIVLFAKQNDRIQKGDKIAEVYSRRTSRSELLTNLVKQSYVIGDESPEPDKLILGEIDRNGELLPEPID